MSWMKPISIVALLLLTPALCSATGTDVELAKKYYKLGAELNKRGDYTRALTWTSTVAALPGAILVFIPPIIVAATGLVFVPLSWHWASRTATIERRQIESWVQDP